MDTHAHNGSTTAYSIEAEQRAGLSSLKEFLQSPAYKITFYTCVTIIMIVVFFGNGLILISYAKFSYIRATLYTLIIHLSIADTFLGGHILMLLLEEIFTSLKTYKMYCIVKFAVGRMYMFVGLAIHILMTIDRFLAVRWPIKHFVYTKKKRLLWAILVCVWTISLGSSTLMFFLHIYADDKANESKGGFVCAYGKVLDESSRKWFFCIFCGLTMATIIMDFTLYCIIRRIITQGERQSSSNASNSKVAMFNMVLALYVLFVASWGPLSAVFVVSAFYPEEYRLHYALAWLPILPFANSGIHWIVYGYSNPKFKRAFRHILTCGKLRSTRNSFNQFST